MREALFVENTHRSWCTGEASIEIFYAIDHQLPIGIQSCRLFLGSETCQENSNLRNECHVRH